MARWFAIAGGRSSEAEQGLWSWLAADRLLGSRCSSICSQPADQSGAVSWVDKTHESHGDLPPGCSAHRASPLIVASQIRHCRQRHQQMHAHESWQFAVAHLSLPD